MNILEARVTQQLINTVLSDPNITYGFESEFYFTGTDQFLQKVFLNGHEYDDGEQFYKKSLGEATWADIAAYFDPLGVSHDEEEDNSQISYNRLMTLFYKISGSNESVNPVDAFSELRAELSMPEIMAAMKIYPREGFDVSEPQQNALRNVFARGSVQKASLMGKLENTYFWSQDEEEMDNLLFLDVGTRNVFYEIVSNRFTRLLGQNVAFEADEDTAKNRLQMSNYGTYLITSDSSLLDGETEGDAIGCELVSPANPLGKGIQQMELLFNAMNDPSKIGFKTLGIETNSSTGFHINLGMGGRKIDPLKLIMLMGDRRILQQFDREYSTQAQKTYQEVVSKVEGDPNMYWKIIGEFIKGVGTSRTNIQLVIDMINTMIPRNKFFSVNLSKLMEGYVEFRAVGGNYHTNFETIRKTVLSLAVWMYVASEPEIYRKDYYRAIWRFIQKAQKGIEIQQELNRVPGN